MASIVRLKVAAAALLVLAGASGAAMAQSYAAMSCDQLWYARNSIYAAKGYCFKTARARAVFGPRCFAPFGKLNTGEQSQVNAIQGWERSKGCR